MHAGSDSQQDTERAGRISRASQGRQSYVKPFRTVVDAVRHSQEKNRRPAGQASVKGLKRLEVTSHHCACSSEDDYAHSSWREYRSNGFDAWPSWCRLHDRQGSLRLTRGQNRVSCDTQAQAYEYMSQHPDSQKQVGRVKDVPGWYHSHPGYSCWPSDIGVQLSTWINRITVSTFSLIFNHSEMRNLTSTRVQRSKYSCSQQKT